jgi:large subunit ribosomal protein L23
MSEKAYDLSESQNTYVFEIPVDINSNAIASAVADQFSVSVKAVRIANIPGKSKRNVRSKSRGNKSGKRSDMHKAYVTLNEGDKLPIFAAVEAQEKADADAQKKAEKIAEKASKKEKK